MKNPYKYEPIEFNPKALPGWLTEVNPTSFEQSLNTWQQLDSNDLTLKKKKRDEATSEGIESEIKRRKSSGEDSSFDEMVKVAQSIAMGQGDIESAAKFDQIIRTRDDLDLNREYKRAQIERSRALTQKSQQGKAPKEVDVFGPGGQQIRVPHTTEGLRGANASGFYTEDQISVNPKLMGMIMGAEKAPPVGGDQRQVGGAYGSLFGQMNSPARPGDEVVRVRKKTKLSEDEVNKKK